MERREDDLLKRVFLAQKENPSQGDFVRIVEKYLKELGVIFEQATSNSMSKDQLKTLLKKNATNAALESLKSMLSEHTKVKSINYHKLEMQPYLRSSSLSQEETGILTSFRSQCTRGIRNNFRKMFQNLNCPLKCYPENQIDDQDHILKCQKLNTKQTKVVLENIFAAFKTK